jgi:hypothetical protein
MNLAQKISNDLNLTFIEEEEPEGNVCFANSDELRPEFKEFFTSADLSNYEYAVSHSEKKYKEILVYESILKDRLIFWKLVALGSEMKIKKK